MKDLEREIELLEKKLELLKLIKQTQDEIKVTERPVYVPYPVYPPPSIPPYNPWPGYPQPYIGDWPFPQTTWTSGSATGVDFKGYMT